MKNIFFICMFGLLAFAGCSDNEGGNIDRRQYRHRYASS